MVDTMPKQDTKSVENFDYQSEPRESALTAHAFRTLCSE